MLEGLYQGKGVSNWLLFKEQFHSLRMDEHTKVYDHLNVLNGIVSELEIIGFKIDDEDKVLRLVWFIPSSYEHIKPVLIFGMETLSFEEVAGKITYEERRLKGEDNNSSNSVLVSRGRPCMKKHNETGVKCWKYGKITHVKCKCSDGAMLEKVSESNASNVSLTLGDDDLL